jgi:hypothetical protein
MPPSLPRGAATWEASSPRRVAADHARAELANSSGS